MNSEPHTQASGMVAPATERRHALRPADAGVVPADALTVRAEISEEQIFDMIDLYRQWADEENRPFSEDSLRGYFVECLTAGVLVPIVLLDGETPVGCVMFTIFQEIFSGRRGCMGDQMYIIPEARGRHGGRLIYAACEAFADAFGAVYRRVPARLELADYYREHMLPPQFKAETIIFSTEAT